jgi:hypothetical protein
MNLKNKFMNQLWEIEDKLDELGLFVNGIDGRTSHSDAYMSVLDYEKVIEHKDKIKEMIGSSEMLKQCLKEWTPSRSTPLNLLAKFMERNWNVTFYKPVVIN